MKKFLLMTLASLFILTGCSFNGGNAIVKVNNKPITKAQFDKEFNKIASNSMLAQMNIKVPQDDNNYMYLMIKDKVINEMIVKALINQEIEKRHIKVTNKDVNKELQTMIDKIGSKEQFNEILKRNGISNDQFMADLKEEVKVKKLVTLVEDVKISDHQAENFYKKNLSKFTYPDKVRASHILIMANPIQIETQIRAKNKTESETIIKEKVAAEMAAKKQKADALYQELKNLPDNFEKVAREQSEDTMSAKKGGDLGFFAKNDMVEEFATQAFKQQPNTIGPVIQTQYGYHIIKVTDRMVAGKEPFAKVKDQIKLYLQTQKQMEILQRLVTQIKTDAKIEYVDDSFNPGKIQEKLKEIAKARQTANKK